MHGNVDDHESRATNPIPADGSELRNTPANGSGGDDWFYEAARVLLGDKDTGLLLHYDSGYPQSSCYAYVAKDPQKRRAPPEHLVRTLIHSEKGEPWHAAFMGGCTASWWLRRKRERELAALAWHVFSQLEGDDQQLKPTGKGLHGKSLGMQNSG